MALIVAQAATTAAADPIDAGIKALEASKFEQAEQEFLKAVAADASDYSAHFHLALARTFLNKDQEAIAGFRKTLEMKPGLFEAQINLGLLLVRYQKFADAIEPLAGAVTQKPGDVRALFHLAEAQRELKDCAAAAPNYRRALAVDATLSAAEIGLARCLTASNLEEAAKLLEKNQAWAELAQAYEDAGKLDLAIPIWEKLPPELPVLTRLAAGYLKTKQLEKAAAAVTRALKLAPNDYDLHLTLGRLLRDKKQLAPAANEFAKAANLKPAEPEPLRELAGMLISLEDYPRALAVLDRLKAMNAETPGQMFFRAVVLDKMQQFKPALAAYRAFLEASNGKFPDEEFKARQRAKTLDKEGSRR